MRGVLGGLARRTRSQALRCESSAIMIRNDPTRVAALCSATGTSTASSTLQQSSAPPRLRVPRHAQAGAARCWISPESRCTQKCCLVDRDTLTSHPHAICNSSYFHTGPVCVGNAPPSSSTSLLLYFPARAPQPSPEVRDRDRGDQRVERLGAVTQSMLSA